MLLGPLVIPVFSQSLPRRFGEPLVVLEEYQPGQELIAAEPDFVLYSSGQVIYKVRSGEIREFREEQFNRSATQLLIFDLDLSDSLESLPDQIQASDDPDQPSFRLILNFDSVKSIRVYGNVRDSGETIRLRIPPPLREAFRRILQFGDPRDSVWIPDRFEVIFSVDRKPVATPVPWPEGWPGLGDSATVKRLPDLYSIFLGRNWYPAYLDFTGKLKPGQEVQIGNLVGSIYCRFPFPQL